MTDIKKDIKILIVDDSLAMRRIVKNFLNNSDFNNTLEAENGKIALEIIQNNSIDLIISDLNMPVMDGLKMLEILKGDDRTRKIPFIMLTVEAIQKTMNKALALNVDSYIVKPIGESMFINEMLRVITPDSEFSL